MESCQPRDKCGHLGGENERGGLFQLKLWEHRGRLRWTWGIRYRAGICTVVVVWNTVDIRASGSESDECCLSASESLLVISAFLMALFGDCFVMPAPSADARDYEDHPVYHAADQAGVRAHAGE